MDDAVKLYPRIETQLRTADEFIPGVGISVDLKIFALVAPLVVLGTLVLFGYRLDRVIRDYHKGTELRWVMVDAQDGLVGVFALLWLIAILAGPWVLGIVFVQAVVLALRANGALNTPAFETAASLYVGVVLIMLAIATISAPRTLIDLRRRGWGRRGPATSRAASEAAMLERRLLVLCSTLRGLRGLREKGPTEANIAGLVTLSERLYVRHLIYRCGVWGG